MIAPLTQLLKMRAMSVVGIFAFLFLTSKLLQNKAIENSQQRSHFSTLRKSWGGDNLYDIHNSTLGFSKIYVLNMADRVDKRDVWALAGLYSDMTFEFEDGVRGDLIPPKAVPAGWDPSETDKTLGCWRGHMNIVQRMVRERIPSALIFEDDADWDINFKNQMVEFARGTRYLQGSADSGLHSPYGDSWDLLWLGHCGAKNIDDKDGKFYVIHDDPTVPDPTHRYPKRVPNMSPPELQGNYTRLVYEPFIGLCANGYALSLKGAEKILYHFSVEANAPVWDRTIRKLCDAHLSGAQCYATYPSMVDSYRAAGNSSADTDRDVRVNTVFRQKGITNNLVYPLRPNLEYFVRNEVEKIPSAFPEQSLWADINPLTWESPRGKGVFIRKDDFIPMD